MSEYELIDLCHRSGQMTERQWQEHLADADFSAWFEASAHNDRDGKTLEKQGFVK